VVVIPLRAGGTTRPAKVAVVQAADFTELNDLARPRGVRSN
jgi:hypothetical protein